MRLSILLVLSCIAAHANPIIPKVEVWMASEKLVVNLSPSNANVVGTFSFEWTAGRRYPAEVGVTMHLQLPIWLPDRSQDFSLQSFWQAYEKKPYAPETLRLLESALHLRAAVGGNTVHPYVVCEPDRPSSDALSYLPAGAGIEKLQTFKEPGFRCIVVDFTFSPRLLQPQVPVSAWTAYRQPLATSNGEGRFFYVPLFVNQPTNASTTDTNRHSITITAASGSYLAITNGEQTCAVGPGHGLTLSPIHGQRIRAVVRPGANQQGGANGRQPSGSETNRMSAAAASRRSP